MKQLLTITLTAAALVFSVAAAAPPAAPAKSQDKLALAHVNGDAVTVKEVLDVFSNRHSGHAKFLGGDAELRKFLAIVIDDRLLVQEAYDIGLDQDPLVQKLAGDFERRTAVATLVREEIEGRARPTEEDLRSVWKTLNVFLQVRQITVPTKQEAEEIRAAIVHGGDADELARTCSIARSRLNGGHLMVMWGNFTPEWEQAVFSLQPGDVSQVIETPAGYDVVIVENRVDTPLPEFEKVRGEIEPTLYARRLEERKKEYSNELWTRYHVVLQPLSSEFSELAATLAKAPETLVATWDGGKLTLAETFNAQELAQLAAAPRRLAQEEMTKRIRTTINEPLVARDAVDRKIGQRPEIADEVLKNREYNMEAILYRDHVFKNLAVSDEETSAYFEKNGKDFEAPAQWHVAQILVATEAEAKALREKSKSGSDFAELAQRSSKDFVTAQKGGDLGWISAENVPEEFKEILTLPAGEISKPIHDSAGWHLIKVMEAKGRQPRTLDEVRDQVRDKVLDNKKRALRSEWVEKLRAASKIEIDDAAIKAFVTANQFDEKAAPPQHALQ